MNNILRLTAITIFLQRLWHRPKSPTHEIDIDSLTEEEIDRIYGISGDLLLERMGTYNFTPGAVDEMMAAIGATFEQESESGE